MPWVPLHEAYPDGAYFVQTDYDAFMPLEDHPEFSIVDGTVTWERQLDTEQDNPLSGYAPRVVFARDLSDPILLTVRVTVEDQKAYMQGSGSDPCYARFCEFEGGSGVLDYHYLEGFFGGDFVHFAWPGWGTVSLFENAEPSQQELPPDEFLPFNGVEYALSVQGG